MAAMGRLVAGRYRIVRPLAAGGLGKVWLATDEWRRRSVALKECAPPAGLAGGERDLVARWTVREARAFARVRNPHVVPVLEVLPGESAPWIVMEFVPSRSLLEVIDESGALPPHRVAEIGLAVLDALAAADREGVLHLDVKPSNVLIADDGRILLTDFGPAVTPEGLAALAGAGIVFGSPKYLAPERLDGSGATARADLWSLGAMLYHAVEGHPPYGWQTTEATLRALARRAPDPPRRAGLLTPVLTGLLRHDPDTRWTAEEVAEGLRAAAVPPARPPRPMRRRRLLAAAALVVVAAGLIGGSRAANREGSVPTGAEPIPSVAVVSGPPLRLPPGFTWHVDPAGFRVAVPVGWRTGRIRDRLLLSSPDGGATLRIGPWTEPGRNILAVLIAQESAVRLDGYRRHRIAAPPDTPFPEWDFIYRDPATGSMRVLRRVVDLGGPTYLLEWRAPRQSWTDGQATLAVVLDSFGPAGG